MKKLLLSDIIIDQEFFGKLVRFGLVGFSGVFIDVGFTWFFREKTRLSKYAASSLGFTIATASNYIFNHYWTFKKNNPAEILEFGRFFIVALIGLGISNVIIYFLSEKLRVNFYIAKIIAIIMVSFWNFLANYFYTFA
ncbi:MAG: GtrA family protein [Mucilaginibacter polytrichastri]|nr:GtrA family protein [Mucilaginibacter polytrichastri]